MDSIKYYFKIFLFKFLYNFFSRNFLQKLFSDKIFDSDKTQLQLKNKIDINYNGFKMSFINENKLTKFRIKSFGIKEPETIAWIDNFNKNSCLWDIGANIGLYSIYSAVSKNCDVIAFEPSAFNLQVLSENIFLNSLNDKICVIPLALNNVSKKGLLKMANLDTGHANLSFGIDRGSHGEQIEVNFEYSTVSINLDESQKIFNLKFPDYIKIDVDGIEHFVLKGGLKVLKNAKEVLVELPGTWDEQTTISHSILKESGFVLKHTHNFNPIKNVSASANEIWTKR